MTTRLFAFYMVIAAVAALLLFATLYFLLSFRKLLMFAIFSFAAGNFQIIYSSTFDENRLIITSCLIGFSLLVFVCLLYIPFSESKTGIRFAFSDLNLVQKNALVALVFFQASSVFLSWQNWFVFQAATVTTMFSYLQVSRDAHFSKIIMLTDHERAKIFESRFANSISLTFNRLAVVILFTAMYFSLHDNLPALFLGSPVIYMML